MLEGERNRYFSLIGDIQLRVTDQGVLADPPVGSPFVRNALHGIHTFAAVQVRPSLVIDDSAALNGDPSPKSVRTIPGHFATMRQAREEEFAFVFGEASAERYPIGSPIAMPNIRIPIDLKKFIERSSGIFGQTGTGKSVLTRLILFGLIQSHIASTLTFDMHGEYGTGDPRKPDIPGLSALFPSSMVKVYSLDEKNTESDNHIKLGLNHIQPEDIELLDDELNLRDTFDASTFALRRQFNQQWLSKLLEMSDAELEEFTASGNAHAGALLGLRRKLMYLTRTGYIQHELDRDPVEEIVAQLQDGKHVVVQFGRYSRLRDYLLVANLLTRRIHERYTELTLSTGPGGVLNQVKPLVVVVEEAHKFLNPQAVRQSIFGTIAREMRKFGVSLLVVDQRPSGIDDEIISQLGTRITGLLSDFSDIEAVLSGTGDRSAMRAMLASLEPSRQILVLGHAIPMPMILQTREYGLGLSSERDSDLQRIEAGRALLQAPPRRQRGQSD